MDKNQKHFNIKNLNIERISNRGRKIDNLPPEVSNI